MKLHLDQLSREDLAPTNIDLKAFGGRFLQTFSGDGNQRPGHTCAEEDGGGVLTPGATNPENGPPSKRLRNDDGGAWLVDSAPMSLTCAADTPLHANVEPDWSITPRLAGDGLLTLLADWTSPRRLLEVKIGLARLKDGLVEKRFA
jgi:hypothetical protein